MRNSLLIFGRFTYDSQRILTAVLGLHLSVSNADLTACSESALWKPNGTTTLPPRGRNGYRASALIQKKIKWLLRTRPASAGSILSGTFLEVGANILHCIVLAARGCAEYCGSVPVEEGEFVTPVIGSVNYFDCFTRLHREISLARVQRDGDVRTLFSHILNDVSTGNSGRSCQGNLDRTTLGINDGSHESNQHKSSSRHLPTSPVGGEFYHAPRPARSRIRFSDSL
jgi:hypothetical protein